MGNRFSVLICYKNNKQLQQQQQQTLRFWQALLHPKQNYWNTCKLILIIIEFFLYQNHKKIINYRALILEIVTNMWVHSRIFLFNIFFTVFNVIYKRGHVKHF